MGAEQSKASCLPSGRQLDASGSRRRRTKRGTVRADFFEKSVQYTEELNSNKAACLLDSELELFHSKLQRHTSDVISTVAFGVEHRSLSFNTLAEITGSLLHTNNQVVDVILKCKEDIRKNPELFDLINDYFEGSIQTLNFYNELEKRFKKFNDSLLIIQFALQCFQEETEGNSTKKHTMKAEKLRQFKAAGNPFTYEFSKDIESVCKQLKSTLVKLVRRKKKLDKKLKNFNSWRKVSNVIFAAALTAVIICSVVAAAVAAPPVAAAMAAVSAIPIASVGRWINSMLRKHQDASQRDNDLIGPMQFHTMIALKDLETIKALVDNLESHFNSQLENAGFALRDDEAMLFVIAEIKRRMEELMINIKNLGEKVKRCRSNTIKSRTVVLKKIMKRPSKLVGESGSVSDK